MFPIYAIFIFLGLVILSPAIFAVLLFYLSRTGFVYLGLSPGVAVLVLLLMFVCSFINIPISKKNVVEVYEPLFFGFARRRVRRIQGVSVNLGGAVIPLAIAFFLLTQIPVIPTLIASFAVAFLAFFSSKFVPGRGVVGLIIAPVLFASVFALLFIPEYAAEVAFVSGVLGMILGADIVRLPFIARKAEGVISIGGAGVFDGIFVVGIISALIAGM